MLAGRHVPSIGFSNLVRIPTFVFVLFCLLWQGKAQASALGAQPNALLTIWNLQDLQSKGPVRYGDVLFLQMGRHEVSITAQTGPSFRWFPAPRAFDSCRPTSTILLLYAAVEKYACCSGVPSFLYTYTAIRGSSTGDMYSTNLNLVVFL